MAKGNLINSFRIKGIEFMSTFNEGTTIGGEMLHNIFNAIWVQEKTPKDWARMLVTPIHKKGDKLNPGNYRAISLLFIPDKVFSRILLNRMKLKTEEQLMRANLASDLDVARYSPYSLLDRL